MIHNSEFKHNYKNMKDSLIALCFSLMEQLYFFLYNVSRRNKNTQKLKINFKDVKQLFYGEVILVRVHKASQLAGV